MRGSDLLERMRANPQANWMIADVERLGWECGLIVTAPRRGSHYQMRDPKSGIILTVPAHRSIRAVYVRALVALADRAREQKGGA